jgi:hypothetical protein
MNSEFYLGEITSQARIVAILGTAALLGIIIYLIRKGLLKAGYSLLWFLMVGVLFILSISKNAFFLLSKFLGIYYPPAALFAVVFVLLIIISIHFSVVISRQERRIKRLSQEIALLNKKVSGKKTD